MIAWQVMIFVHTKRMVNQTRVPKSQDPGWKDHGYYFEKFGHLWLVLLTVLLTIKQNPKANVCN